MNINSEISAELNNLIAHPVLINLTNGLYSLDDVKIFAEQYYLLSVSFVEVLLLGSIKIESEIDRGILIDNLFDEHGRGNNQLNHRNLLRKFLTATGSNHNNIKPLIKTSVCIHGMRDLYKTGTQLEILGAFGPGCEAVTAKQYSIIKQALDKHYNFTKNDLLFFITHISHDSKHGDDINNIIDRLVDNNEDLSQVVSGAKQSMILEEIFWDGIYEELLTSKTNS